jgi:hypothetical protein
MSTIPKVIEYLLQYSIETGTTLRSTSDLSPLEEWLLNKLQSTEQLKQHGVMQVPFNEHCIYSGLDTCPYHNHVKAGKLKVKKIGRKLQIVQ